MREPGRCANASHCIARQVGRGDQVAHDSNEPIAWMISACHWYTSCLSSATTYRWYDIKRRVSTTLCHHGCTEIVRSGRDVFGHLSRGGYRHDYIWHLYDYHDWWLLSPGQEEWMTVQYTRAKLWCSREYIREIVGKLGDCDRIRGVCKCTGLDYSPQCHAYMEGGKEAISWRE